MAYVDRQSGAQRAASLASAAIIQAAIGAVLVYGLAADYFIKHEDGPLIARNFPIPPTPPPTERPTQVDHTKSVVTAPTPPFDFPPANPGPATIPTQGPLDGGFITPTALPTFTAGPFPKPPLFTPRGARPSGDQSRWVTTEDYPASDIRGEHTGTTRYRVAIGANGKVTGCDIVKSSGWAGLDKAACANVSRRAKFEPGTDETGAKAAGSYTGAVVWTIPRN